MNRVSSQKTLVIVDSVEHTQSPILFVGIPEY